MSNDNRKKHLVYKSALATKYNISLDTFNMWIEKIKDKIPMYIEKQRRFSPSQVVFFDSLFAYNPNDLDMDF